ncbi:MAG: metallophosphoesterase [Nanoarchaeota archaeon]|nr:metallophosphoesterase [Nanoarchaeota archaeon]
MHILAFTDTHGNKRAFEMLLQKSKKADILVCAGDISDWGEGIEQEIKLFEKLGKPLLIVPGNHEGDNALRQICKKYDFCYYIHKASYEMENFVFFGFGDGGFSEMDLEFEKIAEKFKKTIEEGKEIILVTHGPPYGTKVDIIPGLGHRGSKSLTEFIKEFKPLLHICGHFHDNNGKRDMIGKTVVINPGPLGQLIKV